MSTRQRFAVKRTSLQCSKYAASKISEYNVEFDLKLQIKMVDGSVAEQLMHFLHNVNDVKFVAFFCDEPKTNKHVKLSKCVPLVSHHEST